MLQRRRFGLVLRGGAYGYQCEIMAGAHDECRARGIDLVCLGGGNISEPDPRNFVYKLAEHVVTDGWIVATSTLGAREDGPEVTALLEHLPRGVPACIIGSPVTGLPTVCVDNVSGVRELTCHLIREHGRRRIAFLAGTNRESEQRLAGYQQALTDCGLAHDPRRVVPGYFMSSGGALAVETLLSEGGPGCDAIVAANDWMAIGALEALDARGIKVPDEIAVVGFDDIDESRFLTPPLTTIRQPPRQLGVEAVRLLFERLDGADGPMERLLPTSVQLRRSCGCFAATELELSTSPQPSQLTLGEVLALHRDDWVQALRSRADSPAPSDAEGAEQFASAFASDLLATGPSQFLSTLERLLRKYDHLGNVVGWHDTIASLRAASIPQLIELSLPRLRAEGIFQHAHILIGDYAERLQSKRSLRKDTMMRALDLLGADLRTAFDVQSLRASLDKHMPSLALPSCYVADVKQEMTAGTEARLLYAFGRQQTRPAALDSEAVYRAGELIPSGQEPLERSSMVVKPLFSGERPLGFCLMEIGAFDGQLYETFPELVSTSLRATQLSRALVEEATRRQRAEQQRMSQELEIAARIQTALLPARREVGGLQIAACMLPATEVGGDYFDILPTEDGCWLGIGDVTGHGLSSGLVMLMVQSATAATIRSNPQLKAGSAWRAINTVLCDNIRQRMAHDEHVTLTLIRYRSDGRLSFCGAHEDLIVYRKRTGRCELVPTPGVWAGILEDVPADQTLESSLELAPGDVLLLYTDGLIEATNAGNEELGSERLCTLLAEAAALSVEEIREHILAALQRWMVQQLDDVTLLVARYTG